MSSRTEGNTLKKEESLEKVHLEREESEDTINLTELFGALLDKWHMLVLLTLAGMLLTSAYAFFCITPTYQSEAKLYAVSASGDSVVDLTDLNIGTSLTNDYKELIMSYPVLDRVSELLNLNMTSEELAEIVTLTNPSNTRILTITAITTSPQLSADIVNTVAGVAQDYLPETMGTPRLNVAQVGKVPDKKYAPGYIKMTLIGGVVAFLLTAAYYVIRFLLDDTIRTQADIEDALGIPLLASIPAQAIEHKHHSSHGQKGEEI